MLEKSLRRVRGGHKLTPQVPVYSAEKTCDQQVGREDWDNKVRVELVALTLALTHKIAVPVWDSQVSIRVCVPCQPGVPECFFF